MADAPKLLGSDSLRTGYPKINLAIDNANSAKAVATEAKSQAESTQNQLDAVIIESGTSDAEVLQARTNKEGIVFNTLKDRIDHQQDFINVKSFGAVGDGIADDTAALQTAIDYARDNNIRKVLVPDGVYLAENVLLHGNIFLTGQKNSKLKMKSNIVDGCLVGVNQSGGGNADPSFNTRKIKITDITLEGRSVEDAFQEHSHLFSAMAVSDVLIENCEFLAPQGDAIYLGGGPSGTERHNERIVIRGCTFDGVNNDNRNGISIIDGKDIVIENNLFKNISRTDMPGPIDIEPNSTTDKYFVIQNIKIKNNRFTDCGGNSGFITVYVPNAHLLTTPVFGIDIADNFTSDLGLFIFINLDGYTVDDSTSHHGVNITGNMSINNTPFQLKGVRGANISDNHFSDYNTPLIGDSTISANGNCLDVILNKNIFINAKTNTAIKVGKTNYLLISNNIFDDSINVGTNYVLVFNTDAANTTSGLSIVNNIVRGNFYDFYRGINHTVDFSKLRSLGNLLEPNILDSINNYTTAKLPEDFPIGEFLSVVSGDAGLPTVNQQGVLKTIRASGTSVPPRYTIQYFYPANNSTTELQSTYYRKGASSSNAWSAWVKVTGV